MAWYGSVARTGPHGRMSTARSSKRERKCRSSRSGARPPWSPNTEKEPALGIALIVIAAVAVLTVLVPLAKTVRVIPPARAGVVERFGRYSRTLNPGLAIVVPFVDRLRPLIDLREQVVTFQP